LVVSYVWFRKRKKKKINAINDSLVGKFEGIPLCLPKGHVTRRKGPYQQQFIWSTLKLKSVGTHSHSFQDLRNWAWSKALSSKLEDEFFSKKGRMMQDETRIIRSLVLFKL
jgi:hypothetical protein